MIHNQELTYICRKLQLDYKLNNIFLILIAMDYKKWNNKNKNSI